MQRFTGWIFGGNGIMKWSVMGSEMLVEMASETRRKAAPELTVIPGTCYSVEGNDR